MFYNRDEKWLTNTGPLMRREDYEDLYEDGRNWPMISAPRGVELDFGSRLDGELSARRERLVALLPHPDDYDARAVRFEERVRQIDEKIAALEEDTRESNSSRRQGAGWRVATRSALTWVLAACVVGLLAIWHYPSMVRHESVALLSAITVLGCVHIGAWRGHLRGLFRPLSLWWLRRTHDHNQGKADQMRMKGKLAHRGRQQITAFIEATGKSILAEFEAHYALAKETQLVRDPGTN